MVNFSVSMCVYGKDNPQWFQRALDSVLCQTIKPSEVVVVIDGPVPTETEEVIAKYEGGNLIKVIKLAENQGHGNARRIGLDNCSFELVALMDADDISLPDRFEKQLNIFAHNQNLSLVGGQISEFTENPYNPIAFRKVPTSDKEIKEYIKKRCPINQPSVMFKKSDVLKAGGYLDWFCNEDYFLWTRMCLQNMEMANSSDVLVCMRVSETYYKRRGGLKYFKSERLLQKYMMKQGLIGRIRYLINVLERFIIQVLLPNKLRGWLFKKMARDRA